MNENELRGLMRGLAQPEPPLQLNAEDIMADGRKRSRRKTAAAGLVAVGAIAAISLPITIAAAGDDSGHTGGGPTAPPAPVPASQTPRQLPSRPPLPVPAGPTAAPTQLVPPTAAPTQLTPAQTPGLPTASPSQVPYPPSAAPTRLVPARPRLGDPTAAPTQLVPPTAAPTQLTPAQTPGLPTAAPTQMEPPTLVTPARPKLAPSTAPMQTPPLVGTK